MLSDPSRKASPHRGALTVSITQGSVLPGSEHLKDTDIVKFWNRMANIKTGWKGEHCLIGCWETARWIKGSLCEHESLYSELQHLWKSLKCGPSLQPQCSSACTGELELTASQSSQEVRPTLSERPCLKS